VLLGDFDSIDPATLAAYAVQGVEIHEHDRHKDASDLELAVTLLRARAAERIVATNVLGGRLDHALAAIGVLAAAAEAGSAVSIVEDTELVYFLAAATPSFSLNLDLSAQRAAGKEPTISLIPWGGPATVSACGFEWPLEHAQLTTGSSLGVSNIGRVDAPRVEVQSGTLLVVLSR
jgi:thiamine pyrophosphokinase